MAFLGSLLEHHTFRVRPSECDPAPLSTRDIRIETKSHDPRIDPCPARCEDGRSIWCAVRQVAGAAAAELPRFHSKPKYADQGRVGRPRGRTDLRIRGY